MTGSTASNPYEEPHHYSSSWRAKTQASSTPTTARSKQRSAKAAEIERVNAILARKLRSVKREPASKFHAPDGDASLRPKAKRGPKGPAGAAGGNGKHGIGAGDKKRADVVSTRYTCNASGGMKTAAAGAAATAGASQENGHHSRTWPPPRPHSVRARDEARRIKEGNATLRRALEEQYKPGRDSQLVAGGKGRPVDGLDMWKKRLSLYDPDPPSFAATVEKAGGERRGDDPYAVVPFFVQLFGCLDSCRARAFALRTFD